MMFEYPALGFSSSVQMSDSADTRIVAAKVIGAVASTGAGVVLNAGEDYDTHGAMSGSRYTIPVSGWYSIKGNVRQSSSANVTFYAYVNGSLTEELVAIGSADQLTHSYATSRFCTQGQVIDIRPNNTVTLNQFTFAIERLAGPQAIAASEKIRVMVNQTSGQSIPNNSDTTVIFNNVARDTHGIYNTGTGRIKLPRAASGKVKTNLASSFTGTGAYTMYAMVYKNGIPYKQISQKVYNSTSSASFSYADGSSCDIEGVAGDEFFVAAFQNTGAARNLIASSTLCWADFTLE